MQSFNTETDTAPSPESDQQTSIVGATGELQPGDCIRVELPDGDELAVYNVDGEFYATDNFCPHKGAPLSEGLLCEHVIECALHGWQFDVRNGECLTVLDRLKTYEVFVEDGFIKVSHRSR